jgi:glycosylphosphatidylinositol transamidase
VTILVEQLAQLGLEVHTQEFAAVLPHLQHPVNGSNVYATLRAQRGSGMEALLIHVPMDNIYSVSFALAFANFCKGKGIWAKDLVFLFTSEDEWGPQAWVEAYFGIHNPKLLHEPLLSRSGSIQAAITLDLHTFNINHIDISTVSQNGLLPNQDIFNALVTVCKKSGMAVSFDGQPSGGEFYESSDYVGLVKTLMNMVALQASGHQSGLHGAFVRYHIDALTIRGGGPSGVHVSGLMKFGRYGP